MARMILVSFAGYPFTPSSLMPDNGLANLAGTLVASGHEARIMDYGTVDTMKRLFPASVSRRLAPMVEKVFSGGKPGLLDLWRAFSSDRKLRRHQAREYRRIAGEIIDEIDRLSADAVGFKLWNGDGFLGTVRMAGLIRKARPEVKLFAGGPHVDWFKTEIFNHTTVFDGLIAGEGEPMITALAEMVERRRDPDDVPNLMYLRDGKYRRTSRTCVENLDELALPNYEPSVYPAVHGGGQIRMATIDESRGCPGKCAFCLHGDKSGSHWRFKSPGRLVSELTSITGQIGSNCFIYAGSNTPSKAAKANARAMVEAGLGVRYACFGHIKGMHHVDFDLLHRSGCRAIFYGLESASKRILDVSMNKEIPLDRARQILADMRRNDIASVTSVIFPAPFEDDQSRRDTIEFLSEVRPDSVPVQFPGLIPGTRWDRKAEQFGFKFPRGRARARRTGLTYKIKLIYPPRFWAKLPYTLHDKSSRALAAETGAFIKDLEAEGLVTGVGHDLCLMARELGWSIGEFRDHCRKVFLSGDVEQAARLVDDINHAMSRPSDVEAAEPSTERAGDVANIRNATA